MTFHLHKFPLMSKSRKLHNLITETNPSNPHQQVDTNEIEEVQCQISLSDFPSCSESFEIAAKFCYGVKSDLSSFNVVSLRCAGEYLEMTEEYSEDNLISKTERFLSQSVLKSFKELLRALKSFMHDMGLIHTDLKPENVAMMERVLGPMPQHMLKRAEYVLSLGISSYFKVQITFVRLYSSLPPLPLLYSWFSRHTEKYVRRGRLDWPEGATSQESIKAVLKLHHRLQEDDHMAVTDMQLNNNY
ncbi:hypothetical protein ACFX2I_021192 [Malus domestica]